MIVGLETQAQLLSQMVKMSKQFHGISIRGAGILMVYTRPGKMIKKSPNIWLGFLMFPLSKHRVSYSKGGRFTSMAKGRL
ncbi:hypothetical protein NY2A_b845R [Paramecium bursaria Chlorella virus NY2A]|uniref:Uncharacterized protein b845R n=1 Tax=Paramecium bursaria Chlorella virus NY2A TaxID=46021 RepID=A7IY20_PBCVN|nr:hypothetical protein NY2A_b845R [Paramecium bursaria Chlorella virus NY2A]ABT15244.1 hypothetical protein NY2A_b845R [Paramecium bursaria Chlorella virus NY2A]